MSKLLLESSLSNIYYWKKFKEKFKIQNEHIFEPGWQITWFLSA